MSALDDFVRVVAQDDVRLDVGAALLPAVLRPPVPLDAVLASLDELAASCPANTFAALRAHLFGSCGLRGNVHEYGDPENSFLDAVLERRVGSPISLAVVVIEVGRRLGVGIEPIGMPGHFLVRDSASGAYCDPFHGGAVLDAEGCRRRHDAVFGGRRALLPDDLEPVTTRQVLARMLANLAQSRLAARPQTLATMLCMHRAIPDLAAGERLALAARLDSIERYADAGAEAERAAIDLTGDARVAALTAANAYRARGELNVSDSEPRELAMFPLGTVLLPGELLPLHVFEHRYRVMMGELLGELDARAATGAGELGIVLIERGHEVGGGDERFDAACLARVVRSERAPDGRYAIVVVGIAPVTVTAWLDDDPYPRALTAERIAEPPLDTDVVAATARVRERAVALATVLGGVLDPVALEGDADTLVHRVASVFGVGPLDRQRLLAAPHVGERLDLLTAMLDDAISVASLRRDGPPSQ